MAKRQLPPRCNRGKNTFYTLQIEKIQDQKTNATLIKNKKQNQALVSQESEKKQKNSLRSCRQIFNENKRNFKFTRGIHYFYDLSKLQRVTQSVSYAFFSSKKQTKANKTNKYTITYSKDNEILGNTNIGSLINRNYIGLPENKQPQIELPGSFIYNQKTLNQVIQMKRNDKNQCHHFLFEAEDKKHNLDRMINQLQFIYKRIDFFLMVQNKHKLKKFSIIEKDNELSQALIQISQLSNQQKKNILKKKIDNLLEKRQKLNYVYEQVSATYYQNSLDQKLYNQIKIQKQKLSRFSIYHEMQKSIKQLQKQNYVTDNSTILDNFHNFHQQSSYSLRSQIDDYFCIDQKVLDSFIMQKTFKLISIRLFQQGENCFYFAKKIFLKLFNKQMKLQKQIKPMTMQQYGDKIKQIQQILSRYCEKSSLKLQDQPKFIQADSMARKNNKSKTLKKSLIKSISKQQIRISINQRVVPIQFYQFYCLKIFMMLYESLATIKQFLQRNQNKRLNIVHHLASLYYPKLQNRLLGIVKLSKFGLLTEALDKLVDVILHPKKQFQSMNYELFVQFIQKDKHILTFLKQIQSQSVSEQSSTYKRAGSVSQLQIENRQIKINEEIIYNVTRKITKVEK